MKEIQIFYFCENKKVPDPPSSKAHGESDNKLANLGQPMSDDCYLPPRKRKGIDMKTSFVIMQKKKRIIIFHKKGFAFSLILRVRVFETRKWPSFVLPSLLID